METADKEGVRGGICEQQKGLSPGAHHMGVLCLQGMLKLQVRVGRGNGGLGDHGAS